MYGSRAKGGFLSDSDYEVGVVFNEADKISTSEIQKLFDNEDKLRIYAFTYEDIISKKSITPFQNNIYFFELVLSAKTLYGKNIFLELNGLEISLLNLLQELRFCIGRCISGLLEFREGNLELANESIYKSCLYGARCLQIFELKYLPLSYEDIYQLSKNLSFDDKNNCIERSLNIRYGRGVLDIETIYDVLSYLGNVEEFLEKEFGRVGSVILLKK